MTKENKGNSKRKIISNQLDDIRKVYYEKFVVKPISKEKGQSKTQIISSDKVPRGFIR